MNVAIVNTAKHSSFQKYVPLALLKLSTKHKIQNDRVIYLTKGQIPKKKVDIFYFSTIFPFDFKNDVSIISAYAKRYQSSKIHIGGPSISIIPDKFEYFLKKNKNVEFKTGLYNELDSYEPDYNICNVEFSYGFTSRGCINKCPWCIVPKVEGDLRVVRDWRKAIDVKRKIFKGMDNNILACDTGHIEEVFDYINRFDIKVDFNQGMDCEKLMTSENVKKLFIKYKNIWNKIRFAWDSKRVDKYALESLKFLSKNKIKCEDMVWYMLYDDKDSPEIVFNRMKSLIFNPYRDCKIKLMRFKDFKTGGLPRNWGDTGDKWAYWMGMNMTALVSRSTLDKWVLEKDYLTFQKRLAILTKTAKNKKSMQYLRKHLNEY